MRITQTKMKSRNAFTIVEVMIAAAIVLIAIIGTSANRYGAVLNARRADFHSTAVRTALLLCEGWNGTCGSASFNPDNVFSSNLDISRKRRSRCSGRLYDSRQL